MKRGPEVARWAGFPLSVAEAMLIGVPCALAKRINAGRQFLEADLGPTFDAQADLAASQIDKAMKDGPALERWSNRAREFALTHFDAGRISRQFLDLYRDVLHASSHTLDESLVETTS